jgi:hypothetical protein
MEVWQELYCTGCKVFMRFQIDSGMNTVVNVICGICGRNHHRAVKDGRAVEEGRHSKYPVHEILVLRSQCFKEPMLDATKSSVGKYKEERTGHLGKEEDLSEPERDLARSAYMAQLWADYHGGKQ